MSEQNLEAKTIESLNAQIRYFQERARNTQFILNNVLEENIDLKTQVTLLSEKVNQLTLGAEKKTEPHEEKKSKEIDQKSEELSQDASVESSDADSISV